MRFLTSRSEVDDAQQEEYRVDAEKLSLRSDAQHHALNYLYDPERHLVRSSNLTAVLLHGTFYLLHVVTTRALVVGRRHGLAIPYEMQKETNLCGDEKTFPAYAGIGRL